MAKIIDLVESLLVDKSFLVGIDIIGAQGVTPCVRFAESFSPPAFTYQTYRELNRDVGSPWMGTKVILKGSEPHNPLHRIFERGEDPRFFTYAGKVHLYFQIYSEEKYDCKIYIHSIEDNVSLELKFADQRINGKNWGLFEFQDKLLAVYSCDPLVLAEVRPDGILHEVFKERPFKAVWGDDLHDSFGGHRCGTAPLQINETDFLTFTHITSEGTSKPFHQLGAVCFSFDGKIIVRKQITIFREGILLDPYGVYQKGNQIGVWATLSLGDLHAATSFVQTLLFRFDRDLFLAFLGVRRLGPASLAQELP